MEMIPTPSRRGAESIKRVVEVDDAGTYAWFYVLEPKTTDGEEWLACVASIKPGRTVIAPYCLVLTAAMAAVMGRVLVMAPQIGWKR